MRAAANRIFVEAHAFTELTTVEKAKLNAVVWLERLAELTAKKLAAS
jgi:hypothetical protein